MQSDYYPCDVEDIPFYSNHKLCINDKCVCERRTQSQENSGSKVYLVLLDEFYGDTVRSKIFLNFSDALNYSKKVGFNAIIVDKILE
jgi:hypothetical protein